MPMPLTILVIPANGVGHVNACAGTIRPMLRRGHRVIFMVDKPFKGKLAKFGFEEHLVEMTKFDQKDDNDDDQSTTATASAAGEHWARALLSLGVLGPDSLELKYRRAMDAFTFSPAAIEHFKLLDVLSREAIDRYRPDLIVIDAFIAPSVFHSGIPWVNNISLVPLMECCFEPGFEHLPPACSAIPSTAPQTEQWHRFKELNRGARISPLINDVIEALGYPRYPEDRMLPYQRALLTVYAAPEEYNFAAIRDQTGWFNLECFNKPEASRDPLVPLTELIPSHFYASALDGHWSGRFIYFSLGSMGSIDLTLMRRLLSVLATDPLCRRHKFIVSKGPSGDQLPSLPPNCWGQDYLPQAQLTPHMDLVVTHGGNNTVTETFALGKPMLILPLFTDQWDNATRLSELGLAAMIDPYHFEDEQLGQAIERLLDDTKLHRRLKLAAERITSERNNTHERLADEIERRLEALRIGGKE